MRRLLGGLLIFFFTLPLISYLYYPSLLGYDNLLSNILRKIVYIFRVLVGEDNTVPFLILLNISFLPLVFKRSFYHFFKNLLGLELVAIGWLGIYGISTQDRKPYIIGVITYDLSNLFSNLLGYVLSYIVFLVLGIIGLLLIITSYRTSSRVAGIIFGSTVFVIGKISEFVRSLFEYDERGVVFENPKSQPSQSKSSGFSVNSVSDGSNSKKRDVFIEITEIDDTDDKDRSKNKDVYKTSSDNDYQEKNLAAYDHLRGLFRSDETYRTSQDDFSYLEEDFEKFSGDADESLHKENNRIMDVEIVREDEEESLNEFSKDKVNYSNDTGVFTGKYPPPIELLDEVEFDTINSVDVLKEVEDTKRIIKNTFTEFKIDADIEGVVRGPVVTMYEVRPKPGTKIAKIVNISDNLALNLATSRVRIVYPIPGKSVIGVEIPNKVRRIVKIREILESREYRDSKVRLPLVIGVDIHGRPVVEDLTQMPHLLIAGSTGSGKSVYVNSIIAGLLYSKGPDELKFIMIDLKIVELKVYNGIPHLLTPVITTPSKSKAVLEWLVAEMQYRYKKLEYLGSRDIVQYNAKVSKIGDETLEKLPYIVLIIDEYADLMMTSPKETEDYITRLAAMSRAVGIHLIIATQRPSVDVVTGLIKANFPARVAFRVASKVDSRTILDTIGAEKLLGKGDLLFTSPSHPTLLRVQGSYISNEEVERVVNYLIEQDSPNYIDLSQYEEETRREESEFEDEGEEFSDELYNQAIEIVVREKKASASYLQRRLRIGYNRAARMIERMEQEGIVGPQQGSKPREILIDESLLDKFRKTK
ncbi:MAG: DNA translocase FtsK [Spirochaetia bacterium]|nr:DNA translocase FtsK [Spirochaetota bacterium]MDW8112561.1 DNA translocase FtsK [Spirochaetia bacterium]